MRDDPEVKEELTRAEKVKQRAKDHLNARQQNYITTFPKESPTAMAVLENLADFCRANETTYSVDARDHAILEGRRQVWLHINEHLNLTTQELWEIRTKTRY